jgi:hypothetical protein
MPLMRINIKKQHKKHQNSLYISHLKSKNGNKPAAVPFIKFVEMCRKL